MTDKIKDEITLDGAAITTEALQEALTKVEEGKKIVEKAEGEFRTLERMKG